MGILQLFLLLLCTGGCYSKKYHNYTLYRVIPDSLDKMSFFEQIDDLFNVNYWSRPGVINKSVEFVVAPEMKKILQTVAQQFNITLTVIIDDIQRAFDDQTVKQYIRRDMRTFDWNNYYRTGDIYDWMRYLCKVYPNHMEVFSIGETLEHREILAAKVLSNGTKPRFRVIVEGGIHAREWISVSVVTYLLYQILISQNSTDEDLKHAATDYEWYFVPILNPDGYEYTHVEDRMFRTNKRLVDLNSNFDFEFGTGAVNRRNVSDVYCGPNAFSENESKAMRDFVKSKKTTLKFYLSFHSYGQFIIIPRGRTDKLMEYYEDVKMATDHAAHEIEKKYGTQYKVGNSLSIFGFSASGSSVSWAKQKYNIPYALSILLRDDGTHGFTLPTHLITPTCEEALDGVIALLKKGHDTQIFKKALRSNANGYFKATFLYTVACIITIYL